MLKQAALLPAIGMCPVENRGCDEDSNAGKYEAIKAALGKKKGVRRIARELQTGVGTVLRIKAELAA